MGDGPCARSVHTQEKTVPQQMPEHTNVATGIRTFDPCIREVQNFWLRNVHVYRTATVIVLFSVSIKNYYCISGILVVHFRLFLLPRVLNGFKTQSFSRGYNGRQSEDKNWWRAYMRARVEFRIQLLRILHLIIHAPRNCMMNSIVCFCHMKH
jgi:hypothetical protein